MRFASPFRRRPSRRLVEAETAVQGPPVVEEEVAALPPPPPPPRARPPLLWPWLLLLLVLVAGGLVAWWLLSRDDGDRAGTANSSAVATVTVPNVVGQPRPEAVARIDRSGLAARVVSRPSGNAPPGTVFAEAPGAGSRVASKTVVTLSVSAPASVTVPGVVGQRVVRATAEMRAVGLSVRYAGVLSDRARGTVLGQRPKAGAKVAKGSTVALRVSRGSGAVPSVVGQTLSAAMATLEGSGFKAQAFTVPAAEKSGTVVAQSPQGGTRVPGGSKVRLYVSGGKAAGESPPPPPPPSTKPAKVTVPDVTGQQQEVAQRRLNSAGLKAGVVYLPGQEDQGTVLSQSPDAGGKQKRGARIQLNVSLGPSPGEQRAVPDVLGQSPAAAKATLRNAGFQVQTLPQGVTDPNQIGIVIDEQPAGQRRAPVGSTVTIYVGRAA